MLEISKIKMYQLGQYELEERQMGLLFGGASCTCSCSGSTANYVNHNGTMLYSGGGSYDDLCACACAGPSSNSSNDKTNVSYGYGSSGDGFTCACECGGPQSMVDVGCLQL